MNHISFNIEEKISNFHKKICVTEGNFNLNVMKKYQR